METYISDDNLECEICGYARISVDVESESNSNTSIENQINIISEFVKRRFPKCSLSMYSDRDRSGYTFDQRENYQEMRKILMSGKSKILIVKDFSRFSRRNSWGLVELEFLRDLGVRIISILDNIDCRSAHDDDWVHIQMRFLFNELPVTETSKKVRGIIDSRQKSGKWICAAPYGYILSEKKNQQFEIVPDEAQIIKEIFHLYCEEGWGYKRIANYLTEKNIPTPRTKEKQRAEERGDSFERKSNSAWNISTIQHILRNDFYIGILRQRKYTRTNINGKDKKLDIEENIIFEKNHKSIIDDKVFLYTQELLKQRTAMNYRGASKYDNSYSGFLICGDCGSPMFSMSRPSLKPAYTCGSYHRRGRKGCSSHHTRMDFLDSVLKDYIKMIKINSVDMIETLEKSIANESSSVRDNDSLLKVLNKSLADAKDEFKATKKQKIRELKNADEDEIELIEETYVEIEEELSKRIQGLQEQIKKATEIRNDLVEVNRVARTVFDVFDNIINKEKLSKMDISFIVDKIIVYENEIIDIKLKADIEQLLKTGTLPNKEEFVNFNFDSIGISSAHYTYKSTNHPTKAYTINVIYEGDPSYTTLTVLEKQQHFFYHFLNLSKRLNTNE